MNRTPDLTRRLLPVGCVPEKLAAFLRAEQDKWGRVIKAADVKPD